MKEITCFHRSPLLRVDVRVAFRIILVHIKEHCLLSRRFSIICKMQFLLPKIAVFFILED